MKKQLLTICSMGLLTTSAIAQFTAASIWSINKQVDPMPHNSINLMFFDMSVTYNSTGVPITGMSSSQPGLPLPKFRITSTVTGNTTVCLSSEQEGTDPWEDDERATFISDGTHDTSITIEEANNGSFTNSDKITRHAGATADQYSYWSYYWSFADNEWVLEGKSYIYMTAGRMDSVMEYDFTTPTDSTYEGVVRYYYSNGLDSTVTSGFNPMTSQYEAEEKVIVEQKENGKTKRFSLYSNNNGTWVQSATFTYNNGSATSLKDVQTTNSFALYPNPASTYLQLRFDETFAIKGVQILNLNGQVVKETQNVDSININDLSTGLYFLQVMSDKGISTQKFVKQ